MVTMSTADNALKSFYLDAVTEALNMKVNPLLAKIKKTQADVYGKDVRKVVKPGISGGIGAGTETGDLPTCSEGAYVQLTAPLKNLYGTIEISDKAMRASASDEGAFVNLLEDEMQGLIRSSAFNFGRMLYGDGSGKLTTVSEYLEMNNFIVEDSKNLVEGMIVDILDFEFNPVIGGAGKRIKSINRKENRIILDGEIINSGYINNGQYIVLQGSYQNEMTGLDAIFNGDTIYGLKKSDYAFLQPYKATSVGAISENVIQKAIDEIEENSGSKVNFIVCSWGVKRALTEYYRANQTSLPTMQIEGGYTALNFNGIPVVADRFCPTGTMYLLNTDEIKLYQLCDWQWLENDGGKVLQKHANKPVYSATLVKYAEMLCERPCAQGMLSGITEA